MGKSLSSTVKSNQHIDFSALLLKLYKGCFFSSEQPTDYKDGSNLLHHQYICSF